MIRIDTGHFRELVDRQIGKIVERLDAVARPCPPAPCSFLQEVEQVFGNVADLLFGDDRLGQQHVAGAIAQFLNGRFVEGLDLEHFVHTARKRLPRASREPLVDQDVGDFLVVDRASR